MTEARVVSPLDHFGRVPENLLFAADVTADECRLYAVLTTYDYRRGCEVGVGRDAIAERTGWSVRTVARVLAALEARGAIRRQRQGRGHPNLILLLADLNPDVPEMAYQPMMGQIDPLDRPNGVSHPLINEKNEKTNPEAITNVFDAWAESTGRTGRTKLDDKRRKLITRALDLYPVTEVLDAVRGWEHSAYHRGENEAGKVYNDLGLLLRDAEHIERFRDLAGKRREASPEERTTRTRNGLTERFYPGSGWVEEAG